MKASDIIEVPVATTLNYEGFQLLEGHVLQLADGRRPAVLFAVERPESEEFVTGFEVGLLIARLSARPPAWRGAFHVASGAMLVRAAKALGYQMTSEPPWADGVWMFCDFIPIASPEKCCERDHDGDGNCDRHPAKDTIRRANPLTMRDAVFADLLQDGPLPWKSCACGQTTVDCQCYNDGTDVW